MFRFDKEKIFPVFFSKGITYSKFSSLAGLNQQTAKRAIEGEEIILPVVYRVSKALEIDPLDYLDEESRRELESKGLRKQMKLKFDIWNMPSGRYAVAANTDAGGEAVILPNKTLAEKVLVFVQDIFFEEFKILQVEDVEEKGEYKLIIHCDADKHFELNLEESELELAGAIVTFIKAIWHKTRADKNFVENTLERAKKILQETADE